MAKENEQLYNRIHAAEKATQELREQNAVLQREIDYYSYNERPKTAPSRERRVKSTPVSAFSSFTYPGGLEDSSEQIYTSGATRPVSSLPLPKPRAYERRLPKRPSIPSEFRNASLHTPTTSTFSGSPRPSYHFEQPLPRTPNTYVSGISSPLPGSVTRNAVMLNGINLSTRPAGSTISLAEAYRRNKPLPPLRQTSVSLPAGVVEIGSGGDREQEQPRKAKALHYIFRKGRRKGDNSNA